jgi:hypothetical protein
VFSTNKKIQTKPHNFFLCTRNSSIIFSLHKQKKKLPSSINPEQKKNQNFLILTTKLKQTNKAEKLNVPEQYPNKTKKPTKKQNENTLGRKKGTKKQQKSSELQNSEPQNCMSSFSL